MMCQGWRISASFIFFTYRKQRNYTYTCLNISFNLFNYEKISLFDSSIHRHTAGRTVDQLRGFPRTGTDLGAIRPARGRLFRIRSSGSQRRWKAHHQPASSSDFRYAAAMIANSNGTMSAWFSTPGRNDRLASRRYQSANGSGDEAVRTPCTATATAGRSNTHSTNRSTDGSWTVRDGARIRPASSWETLPME